MPLCTFSEEDSMFATTPVQNLFIQEFMLHAPGDYVKVYLYGLMQSIYPVTAENNLARFAFSLSMTEEEVIRAFQYWQSRGLVRIEKDKKEKPNFVFLDLRNSLSDSPVALQETSLYTHMELANQIAAAVPKHNFLQKEYDLLFDLKDIYHFEDEAIVSLLEFTAERYTPRFTFHRLENIVREWTEKEIQTRAKADEYRMNISLIHSPANWLITKIGISNRHSTQDEHELYQKWIHEWGFSPEAIGEAAKSMVSIRNPNFQYLDRILNTLYHKNLITKEAIETNNSSQKNEGQAVQEIRFALGLLGSVAESERILYQQWKNDYHLDDETILSVAKDMKLMGLTTMKDLDSQLQLYVVRGISNVQAVDHATKLQEQTRNILRTAGSLKNPVEADCKLVEKWLTMYPMAILLEAAKRASNAKQPMLYINKILENWRKEKIETLEEAKNTTSNALPEMPHKKNKKKQAVHFDDERSYDDETLDSLYTPLE